MRRNTLLLGVVALVGATVMLTWGCKKGPEDPFISLKSRDARIKGNWELSKVEFSRRTVTTDPDMTCSPDISSKTVVSDDGVNFTVYDTITRYDFINDKCVIEGEAVPFTGSFKFTVNKDGTYSYSSSSGNTREEGTGYWYWEDSKKNKLFIAFDVNWLLCSLNGFDIDEAANIIWGQWMVERLSSKELVLYKTCVNSYVDGNRQVESKVTVRLVFTKTK